PAWNPSVSFGFPVIASAQIGFFYPVLFILRFLPIYLELPIALTLHVAFCAIGTFLFARRFHISKEAAIIAALSFSLSQFVWQHLTHLNIFLAVAWFPWQMWAVDILFSRGKLHRRGIIALIALFGIPFLAGQIQVPFLMMVVVLLYGIYLRFRKERLGEVMRTVHAVAIICIATFLLASVQLLPTLELSTLSSRATSEGFDITRANQHSYPLYHLPTFVFPKFYGTDSTYWGKRLEIEYGTYVGVIPLMLAVWYLWKGRNFLPSYEGRRGGVEALLKITPSPASAGRSPSYEGEKSTTTFFIYLLVISFLLSLGDLSPFRLIGLEPSLWFFSAPARWLLFTTFSLSLFAGFGFDALWQNIASAKKFFSRIAFVVIGLVIFGNILLAVVSPLPNWGEGLPLGRGEGWLNQISSKNQEKIYSLISSAKTSSISLASPYTYIALVSLVVLPYALSHKHGKKLLLAVTILDLVLIAGTTTPLISWKSILKEPDTLINLPENIKNHQARIYSLRDGGDTGAYFTDPASRADAAKRELQKNLLVPMVSSQFGIYGIEWPASLDLTEQGGVLERLHPTLPYAVEDTELAKELTIGAVLSPTENGGVNITVLESKPRFEVVNGTAELISEQPSKFIIKTSSKQDSTLIVRDTFYPGWHAYVDGAEVPIQKSPLFFRSIPVPAGEHVVTMKYVPKMLYVGGIVSLVTIGLLIILSIKKAGIDHRSHR
ncbi:MAG: YfhO family protein, partial [Patescibacteria group bacterium]